MSNQPQPKRSLSDPSLSISGFEDIAVHLSHQESPEPTEAISTDEAMLAYLNQPIQTKSASVVSPSLAPEPTRTPQSIPKPAPAQTPTTRTAAPIRRFDAPHAQPASTTEAPSTTPAATPASSGVLFKLQQLRTAFTKFSSSPEKPSAPIELSERPPLHVRTRFSGDPRDDARLNWAEDLSEWWHFDIEARTIEHETLWINEQLEALFLKYLKPVWWDRFVEGINDFFTTITNELLQPAWSILTAPFRAIAALIPDIDWPWNFELRGANVSIKQTPFRRMVFDSHLAAQVTEHLWNDPDAFLEAGKLQSKDDFGAMSHVPVKAPQEDGHFAEKAIGSLKRFNLRGVLHSLTRVLLFTRGSRSWTYGRELLDAGVSTPRPLAMVEDRVGPLRLRSFVLTENVSGTPLPDFLANTQLNTLELDRLASQFARIWHTLGDLRIIHGNMQASNFIVTADRRLILTNLDGTWRHWFDLTFLHRRDRDWLRFAKSFRGQPDISAAFRAAVSRHDEELITKPQAVSTARPLQLQRAA